MHIYDFYEPATWDGVKTVMQLTPCGKEKVIFEKQ